MTSAVSKQFKVVALASLLLVSFLVAGWLMIGPFSKRPQDLGVTDGGLRACPDSPNCVCSQDPPADDVHFVPPLQFEGNPAEAFARLREIVSEMPRTSIVTQSEEYMHVEFVSAIMRYVDDVEFLLDPSQGVIHVRSASRVGYSDLGANRKRVEEIRRRFDI
ncbi:DUF1499 domain-containing protein [Stratiformator vulcanicus]|uniref:DUF1499 domain-containing protein n=1 Tax=Stratiformator vulcanicus TaxID=2527980 RepID=A0A517QXH0_9PLAN|nr:DUF1499 domain-containing protein [Stratiformator vulcanicus]QDT36278.1 hypothetical protein Pan189_06340 [Stratiformator vulcanicus]